MPPISSGTLERSDFGNYYYYLEFESGDKPLCIRITLLTKRY